MLILTIYSMERLYIQFGGRVLELRKLKKLSQSELGRRAELSRATIATIESGRQSVSLEQVYKICLALETELSELLPSLSLSQTDKELMKIDRNLNPNDAHKLVLLSKKL